VELVPTPDKNTDILSYFFKKGVLTGFGACNLAGFCRSGFLPQAAACRNKRKGCFRDTTERMRRSVNNGIIGQLSFRTFLISGKKINVSAGDHIRNIFPYIQKFVYFPLLNSANSDR
jgi:hypothetical protein